MVRLNKDSYQENLLGGSLNMLLLDYQVSKKPEPGQEHFGLLAHVTASTRAKIVKCGNGEIDRHLDFIKSKVGSNPYGKKRISKVNTEQAEMDL